MGVQQRLSKRATKWSRHQLPGWWTAAQVLIGVAFAGYLAYSLILPEAPQTPATVAVAPAPQQPAPSSSAPTDEPAPASAAPSGATSEVVGANGDPVQVPQDALEVAQTAFHALYDPTAAKSLPTVNDEVFTGPGVAFPKHTVSALTLVTQNPGASTLVFSADVDPDGKGPLRGDTLTRTVERSGDAWLFNPSR